MSYSIFFSFQLSSNVPLLKGNKANNLNDLCVFLGFNQHNNMRVDVLVFCIDNVGGSMRGKDGDFKI